MKKHFTIVIFILITTIVSAQEVTPLEKQSETKDKIVKVELVKNTSFEDAEAYGKNEFTLNLLSLIGYSVFDLSYERIINVGNSFGINVNIGNNGIANSSGFTKEFSISPYYRMYFLNRRDFGSKGFFAELSVDIATGEYNSEYDINIDNWYNGNYTNTTEDMSGLGIGASLGRKYINRKGASIEIELGGGKYLGKDGGGYGKFGITLGKRF